jgi:hypothetical protein
LDGAERSALKSPSEQTQQVKLAGESIAVVIEPMRITGASLLEERLRLALRAEVIAVAVHGERGRGEFQLLSVRARGTERR